MNCIKPVIKHNIHKEFNPKLSWHSITLNNIEGYRVPFSEIARNGNFCATMAGYDKTSVLPRVFLITDFTCISETISYYKGVKE